jgi:hypothetical protein
LEEELVVCSAPQLHSTPPLKLVSKISYPFQHGRRDARQITHAVKVSFEINEHVKIAFEKPKCISFKESF